MDRNTSKEYLAAAIFQRGTSYRKLSRQLGWSEAKFGQKMNKSNFWAEEFLGIMDSLGFDVSFTDRETGRTLLPLRTGEGRELRRMVEGVIYKTSRAYPVANNFYMDHENRFTEDGTATELYVDRQGRYFFAVYYDDPNRRASIAPVSEAVANAFIEKYGTELHRSHGDDAEDGGDPDLDLEEDGEDDEEEEEEEDGVEDEEDGET